MTAIAGILRAAAWAAAIPFAFTSCGSLETMSERKPADAPVRTAPFGTTKAGAPATLFTLENSRGLVARVTDFGATLVEMHVPDRAGAMVDVVLGFDQVAGYESDANQYFGCTTGRVANRIAKGRFSLDGKEYTLAVNNGPNHLHGGERGFGQRMFSAESLDGAAVRFRYDSPAGEEGYPGAVRVEVTYTLTDADELRIDYTATSDARTPLNLTNHAYWNLAGAGNGTILEHVLELDATRYTPADDTLIPTGEVVAVEGTPLDFTTPRRIGDRIAALEGTAALGYDHNFVVESGAGTVRRAARLADPVSGRVLEIFTTEPGIQFYSGNFLNGATGKGGRAYAHRGALCLETQHFPDSVHHAAFPSTILEPGATYRQTTVHHFSVTDQMDQTDQRP